MKNKTLLLIVLLLFAFTVTGILLASLRHTTYSKVVLEWSTASELNTAGFNLYRSDTVSGDGVLVNQSLIPASRDAQTGGEYEYTDTDVIIGRKYFYFLEDIGNDGLANRHGPVEVVAKKGWKSEWLIGIIFLVIFLLGIIYLTVDKFKTNMKSG